MTISLTKKLAAIGVEGIELTKGYKINGQDSPRVFTFKVTNGPKKRQVEQQGLVVLTQDNGDNKIYADPVGCFIEPVDGETERKEVAILAKQAYSVVGAAESANKDVIVRDNGDGTTTELWPVHNILGALSVMCSVGKMHDNGDGHGATAVERLTNIVYNTLVATEAILKIASRVFLKQVPDADVYSNRYFELSIARENRSVWKERMMPITSEAISVIEEEMCLNTRGPLLVFSVGAEQDLEKEIIKYNGMVPVPEVALRNLVDKIKDRGEDLVFISLSKAPDGSGRVCASNSLITILTSEAKIPEEAIRNILGDRE